MKFIKIAIFLIILLPALAAIGYYTMNVQTLDFESVCDKDHKKYTSLCRHVGKQAYSTKSISEINDKNYGTILGVAWRKKGTIISTVNEKKKRRSESNSYYYIIGDDKRENQFLRITTETDPR